MTLLVAQFSNQNPLDPLDNNELASQLAQLAELGQLESMNTSFETALQTQQEDQATSLLGKTVAYYDDDDNAVTGVVDAVGLSDDTIQVDVGGTVIDLDEIVAVYEE